MVDRIFKGHNIRAFTPLIFFTYGCSLFRELSVIKYRNSYRNLIEQMIDLVQYLRYYSHAVMNTFMWKLFCPHETNRISPAGDFPAEGTAYAIHCMYVQTPRRCIFCVRSGLISTKELPTSAYSSSSRVWISRKYLTWKLYHLRDDFREWNI